MLSSTSRSLALRIRPDLVVSTQRYGYGEYYVVKNPLSLRYFRFEPQEFAILKALDGKRSLDDLKADFEARFAPAKIDFENLATFIGQLHRSGLVMAEGPGQGAELHKRHQSVRRQELRSKLANPLAIRLRGFDPQGLLDRVYPLARWCFSLPAVVAALALGLTALLLVLVQFDAFWARMPEFSQFFTWSNMWCLMAIVIVTKILHELGHGLMCRHFGGECHEMGVMFLVFMPCLYCNVSDAWLWRNKWKRAAVGAAGIYVELVIASLATFGWWFTHSGLLHHLCLSTIFVCSVSTLLFNGNPLLRYDGYYILADLVETPNLSQKGSSVLRRWLSWLCLGIEPSPDPFLPRRHLKLLGLYAAASLVYRWLVMLSILFFLHAFFKSHRLPVLGQFFGALTLAGVIIWPLYAVIKFFWVPGRTDLVKRRRMLWSLAVLSAVLLAVLFVPLPDRVWATLELQPRDAAPVYVEVPGELMQLHVRPGEQVAAGQPLASFENIDVRLDVARLTARRDELMLQMSNLRQQRFRDAKAGLQLAQVQETLLAVEEQLQQRQLDLARLTLKSPISGTIIPASESTALPLADGELPSWSGSPFAVRNMGAHLQPSTMFCRVGDPQQIEAQLVVDQADINFVREGQEVEICLESLPGRRWRGVVREISKADLKQSPRHLSNKSGGELPTETDEAGIERPISTSYQVLVPFNDPRGKLVPGLRGEAKIATSWQPLGVRLWRTFHRTFHFRL